MSRHLWMLPLGLALGGGAVIFAALQLSFNPQQTLTAAVVAALGLGVLLTLLLGLAGLNRRWLALLPLLALLPALLGAGLLAVLPRSAAWGPPLALGASAALGALIAVLVLRRVMPGRPRGIAVIVTWAAAGALYPLLLNGVLMASFGVPGLNSRVALDLLMALPGALGAGAAGLALRGWLR